MHGPWTLLAAAGLLCAAPHREQDEAAVLLVLAVLASISA